MAKNHIFATLRGSAKGGIYAICHSMTVGHFVVIGQRFPNRFKDIFQDARMVE